MGVRASITVITPFTFEEMMSGGNPDCATCKTYFLDKSWSEIHDMLQPAGHPLSLAIIGDTLHPESQHSYDEFLTGNHDYYVGFVSVNLVSQISSLLENIEVVSNPMTPEDLTESNQKGYTMTIDYHGSNFRELQLVYSNASQNGNALMIVIA